MSTQPGEKQAVDREQIRRWKANLETEIDGIAIYRLLAEAEKDPERKAIFDWASSPSFGPRWSAAC